MVEASGHCSVTRSRALQCASESAVTSRLWPDGRQPRAGMEHTAAFVLTRGRRAGRQCGTRGGRGPPCSQQHPRVVMCSSTRVVTAAMWKSPPPTNRMFRFQGVPLGGWQPESAQRDQGRRRALHLRSDQSVWGGEEHRQPRGERYLSPSLCGRTPEARVHPTAQSVPSPHPTVYGSIGFPS